jgi:hypothetical protein
LSDVDYDERNQSIQHKDPRHYRRRGTNNGGGSVLITGEAEKPIMQFLNAEEISKLRIDMESAIKVYRDSTLDKDSSHKKIVFDQYQLLKPDLKDIAVKENFGLVVFWDPNGTKVLRTTLVAFEAD